MLVQKNDDNARLRHHHRFAEKKFTWLGVEIGKPGLLRAALGRCAAVTAGKLVNPTCSINKSLFSSEKRMARRADTNMDIRNSGAG